MTRQGKDERSSAAGELRATARKALAIDAAILAVALLVRAVHLWQLGRSPLFPLVVGDAESYDSWAQRISAGDWLGHGEGVFYQAPLYPYFLAVIYALAGRSLWAVRVVQAVVGSVSCVLLARAGRAWVSAAAGTAAGLVLALYAPAVYFDALVQKSVLDVALVCAVLLVLARARRTDAGPPAPVRWLAVGASLGFLMLTRENAAALVVAVLVWQLVELRREPWRARLRAAGVLVAALAVVLLPVAVRNAVVGGELHLTTSQLGTNFYIGNNERANGLYIPLRPARGNPRFEREDATELAQRALGRPLSPGQVSRYWLGQGLRFVVDEPGRWLALMGRKVLLVLNATEVGDTEDLYGASDYCPLLRALRVPFNFGVLLPLAALGVGLTWRRRSEVWVLYLLAAVYAASVACFYVFARYRYPLVPMLVVLACAGVEAGWVALRSSHRRELVFPVTLAIVFAAVAAPPLVSTTAQRALTEVAIGNDLARRQHLPAEAAPHYARALAAAPASGEACVGLADALLAQGKLDEALERYRQAIAIAPGFEVAEYNYALALADAGRPREALPHFLRAAEINPERSETHDRIGTCLFALGQVREAAEQYRQAIALDAGNATAQNNWGTAMARLGDLAAAVAHFRAAIVLDGSYVEARRNLGKALLAQGRGRDAAAELREALRLRPDDAQTRRWLTEATPGR